MPFRKSNFDHEDAKEVLGKKGISGHLEDNESNSIKQCEFTKYRSWKKNLVIVFFKELQNHWINSDQ